MKYTIRCACCTVIFILTFNIAQSQTRAPFLHDDALTKANAKALAPQLLSQNPGIRFIENKGQIADTKGNARPDIKYYTQSANGVRMYFSTDKISYVFAQYDTTRPPLNPLLSKEGKEGTQNSLSPLLRGTIGDRPKVAQAQSLYRMDMNLLGASPTSIEREGESQDYTNYYYAHCPNGVTNVRSYSTITYKNVYPNIDLVYRQNAAGVKYDLIVNPGGRVSDIRLQYNGADAVTTTADGRIRVTNPLGRIEEAAPYTYQTSALAPTMLDVFDSHNDGAVQTVSASYRISNSIVTFNVGSYDHSQPLVIDPTLQWCTFYGGSGDEDNVYLGYGYMSGIITDGNNNIIVTGGTNSSNFPVSAGAFQTTYGGGGTKATGDAFIVKFDGNGKRQWATYYGGSDYDQGYGIAVDRNSNIFLTGETQSSNFPTTVNAFQTTLQGNENGFLVKFDGTGLRQWATYYGCDYGMSVTTDLNGNVIITGAAESGFPVTNGVFQTTYGGNVDAFVVKFDGNGNCQWATYYGGSKDDQGDGVAIDKNGNIFITGYTGSINFPITAGAFQTNLATKNPGQANAFIVKLSSTGQQLWATYYGGSAFDNGDAIATDSSGNVFITGYTGSSDFPVTAGAYQSIYGGGDDAFIVKLDGNGNRQWATYYGGSSTDEGHGIAVDADGNVLLSGCTFGGFPVTSDAFQSNLTNSAFIVKFNNNGTSRLWATQFGSTNSKVTTYCSAITVDSTRSIIITGTTNETGSNFPVTTGAFQTTEGGGWDAYVAKFGVPCDLVLNFKKKKDTVCRGTGVIVGDTASGGTNPYVYSWTPSKGLSSTNIAMPFAMPDSTTMYYDTVTDAKGCIALDSVKVVVGQIPVMIAGSDILLCPGSSVKIGKAAKNGTPPYKYSWQPSNGLDSANIATPTARPQGTTRYYVTVTDAYGCQTQDSILITVFPQVLAHAGNNVIICRGDSAVIGMDATGGVPPYTYQWSPSSTLNAGNIVSPEASPKITTTYFVTVTDSNGCTNTGSVVVMVNQPPQLNTADTVNQTICTGTSTVIGGVPVSGTTPYTYQWSPASGLDSTTVAAPVASPVVTTTYTVIVTDSNGCQTTGNVTVFVDSLPEPKIHALEATTICEGDSVVLDAGGPYTSYHWSTGAKKEKIIVKNSGSYTVVVTDSAGCIAMSEPFAVTVVQKPSPVIEVTGSLSFCTGDSVILTAPSGFSSYLWSDGETTSEIIVKTPGTYFVTVINANGCSGASAAVSVTVGNSLMPAITGTMGFCPGGSTILDAGSGYDTYQWSTGATTETITVKTPGTYYVSVTKGECSGKSQEVTVSEYSVPIVSIIPSGSLSFCAGDSVVLSASGGFTSYLWSDGETKQNIIVKTSGTYTVAVTDANGCSGTSSSVAVTVGSVLVPVITGAPAFCPGDSTALDAGSGYDTYLWSTGATTETITVTQPGTYTVSVTKGTCAGTSADYKVTVYPMPVATISASGDTLLSSPAASYQWSLNGAAIQGATAQRYIAVLSGNYTVTITDANGCVATSIPFMQAAGIANICIDASPSIVAPQGFMTATMHLTNAIVPPTDSLVFDLHYDAQALELDSIGESPCTVSTKNIALGLVHIKLAACVSPLPAEALCTAAFTPLVSSQDTVYTQLLVDNIKIYPLADSITGAGCSAQVTVLPLCGLHGVFYIGATTLAQNYPNPFTGTTAIHVTLSQSDAQSARLVVCNVLGEQVADLTDQLSANGDVTFKAGANKAGVYYYVLETASGRLTRQMFVVK